MSLVYRTKRILYYGALPGPAYPNAQVPSAPLSSSAGNELPILMQNENGPCPLLALANVLLLRGGIHIHPDYSEVTFEASRSHSHTQRMRTRRLSTNLLGVSTGPLGEAGRAHA